ncbi:E3 ubiquitin ligase complex SCF subunit sconC [Toxocara canis]|uniref:E3 ubiquitin ligase complex SCF subunit sconC n=1 Tax=Toxocara canis TaxID=6265 RepID=A0A0B2USM0_TOXCA|nr:E3 ubiquitin ligase complex SCF subunit sconC [Toxocara canis]
MQQDDGMGGSGEGSNSDEQRNSRLTMSCEVMLRTSDGEIVAADRNAIRHSQLIDGILEDLPKAGDANSASAEPIPLAEVDAKTLKKVLEWCEHHKDDDQLTQKSNTEDEMYVEDIPEWDEQYFKMDDQMLFSVLLDVKQCRDTHFINMECMRAIAAQRHRFDLPIGV